MGEGEHDEHNNENMQIQLEQRFDIPSCPDEEALDLETIVCKALTESVFSSFF